jgi:CheY-like chemotaxis protein
MNILLGMSDLLWETRLTSEQRDYIKFFRRAGNTLLDLINDILDLSKVEAGQMSLELLEFDLHDLIDKTIAFMEALAQEKRVMLAFEVEEGVPVQVVGDANRLRQILINLLGNAIKFTEKGKVVLIVKQDTRETGALEFSVADTGAGIPEEKLAAIFDRYTQASVSSGPGRKGTGLGLSICKRLVGLMGGRIWVKSKLGEGSIFGFNVKFEAGPEMKNTGTAGSSGLAQAETAPDIKRRDLRILLAGGSEENRLLVKAYLPPCHLDVAENGEVAVRKFFAGNYDLVLMDMHMPVMDGYMATKAIRQKENKGKALIIALTGSASNEEEKSLAAGCTAHISKPIRKKQLLRAIDEYSQS